MCKKINNLLSKGVFTKKPNNFSSNLIACACHIEYQKKLLFIQKADGLWGAKRWGIPCGTLEKKETLKDCVFREMKEEISWDMDKKDFKYIAPLYMTNEIQYTFHMFHYLAKTKNDVILSDEHIDYQWIDIENAYTLKLVPGQRQALDHFCEMRKKLSI